ncbi:MAG: choice-of-anchor Q domain-containing protein [Terracidiphilus sp.]
MQIGQRLTIFAASGLSLCVAACGGGAGTQPTPAPIAYTLTVASINPSSAVVITVTPSDNNNAGNGATSFTRTYNAGTSVTLTAPATAGGNQFSSWSGCATASAVTCTVTMNANASVTASYAAPASLVTYYVSGSGSDAADGLSTNTAFLTLQHAANLTHPGDTVYVMNGTYTNSCASCAVLDLTIPGTASQWITYKAYTGQTPQISFNGWQGIFFEPTAAYIEINGFNILGNNYNVTLQAAQNQSTSNPDPAFNGNCIAADGRSGTATVRPNHLRILNNVIGACGGAGVGTAWSDYVTISGNTIYDSAWYSIYGASGISNWENWNADSSTAYKMVITGNRLFGNKQLVPTVGTGVILDGEAIIIDSTRNSVYNSTNDPLPAYTGRTLIANNVIYGNGSSAVEVFESDHVDVVNNSSYQDVTNPPLSGRGEMDLNQTSDVNVINNIFYSATSQNPVAVVPGTTSSIALNYNLYYNGSNLGDVANGPNDLTADPLYADPTAATPADRFSVLLSVAPTSPAVGSGTSYLAPATDFSGNPRPGSKGYDRGAYQQQ